MISSERLKSPWLIGSFLLKPRPSSRVLILASSQRLKSPWLTGLDFFFRSFPDQNRLKHRSSPVSITVWSWDQDWEQRPTTTTTRHPSRRPPSPMATTTTTRCPGTDFATETDTGDLHEHNIATTTATTRPTGRSTTTTTTATAIRTASNDEENNGDEKSRRQQRAQTPTTAPRRSRTT